MAVHFLVAIVAIVGLASSLLTYAYDPSPLQNTCVAAPDNLSAVFVNGKFCKNPKLVTTEDFFIAAGLNSPGNTNNPLGTSLNTVDINRFPGLNTLGLSIVRADFAPDGLIPIHSHPRSSELLVVLEGSLYVGFVNSTPGTRSQLYAKILKPGDVFAIPMGLLHFQYNVGKTKAALLAVSNSQNIGTVTIPNDVFGTQPQISPELLSKAFQLDRKMIDYLQSRTWFAPNTIS